MPDVPTGTVMGVGPRHIDHPRPVRERLTERLTGRTLAVSGGAEGADTLFAEAALAAGVPFEVWLPNRYYRDMYPQAIPQGLLDLAANVRHIVSRPDTSDWRHRWHTEKWWVDNFARNTAMAAAAPEAVVISARHPLELAGERRGGTAHCVRALIAAGHQEVAWVADTANATVTRVPVVQQWNLFTDRSDA